MSDAHPQHNNIDHLVQMANDIGNFFESEGDHEVATSSVAKHIRSFWVPRMRERIIAHLHEGGSGLSVLARAAVDRLARDAASAHNGA